MPTHRIHRIAGLVALTLLTACGTTPVTQPDTEPHAMTIEQPTPLYDASTPAGQQLSWVLKHLNEPTQTATLDELDQHFDAAFKAQVTTAQMQQVFAQLAAGYGPFVVTQTKTAAPESLVVQAKTKTDELWIISIAASPDAPHAITSLLFQPDAAANQANVPKTWDELDAKLKAAATRPALYVAKIDATGPANPSTLFEATFNRRSLHLQALHFGRTRPADRRRQPQLGQELTIKDALKSLPSGVLQDKPAGEKVTVKEAASKMISISDNTATDHLLNLVGRANVEAWVKTSGHSAPERLTPFEHP
ncbi:MAG: serine hydrolase [bacterium]